MKKSLFVGLILFAVTLSPALSYASNNKNKTINPAATKTFKMIPYGKDTVYLHLSGSNIVYPADTFQRFYDPKTNVMCYADRAGADQKGGFSCVYLGKK